MAVRLYSIGIPAALNLALPSLLISCLNGILAGFSQIYVLVLGVYYNCRPFCICRQMELSRECGRWSVTIMEPGK